MICNECAVAFFHDPLKLVIVAASIAVAIITLLLIVKKDLSPGRKVLLIYLHVFSFVFPFVFYSFFSGCSTFFSHCNRLIPVLSMLGLTGLLSAIIGSVAAPIIFLMRNSKSSNRIEDVHIVEFVKRESLMLKIKEPSVYFIDSVKPVAFAFSNIRPVIFVSVGMLDLLERKEIEAVLLHELLHIRNGTSIFRFSAFFLKTFSPLSMFTSFNNELNREERLADNFAVRRQGTNAHLSSAKHKINLFFLEAK